MPDVSTRPARLACAAALAVLVVGCGPTPYEPAAGPGDTGYETTQLAQDRYLVSFEGNAATARQTVETYMLYRAAEVAARTGHPYFAVVEGDVERDVDVNIYYSEPGLYGYGPGFGIGPGFGFPYSSTVGFGTGAGYGSGFGTGLSVGVGYGTGLGVRIGYGTGLGVGPAGYGYGASPAVTTTDSYEAFVTVEMLESRPAGRPDVFTTQNVLATLGSSIERSGR